MSRTRIKNVVFVCTGNINRSSAAEALAKRWAKHWEITDVEFSSAATSPKNAGRLMTKKMREAIDLPKADAPRSRPLDEAIASGADLILCVQQHHVQKVKEMFPGAAKKVRLLGDYGEVGDIADPHFNGKHADAAAQINRATKALCETLR